METEEKDPIAVPNSASPSITNSYTKSASKIAKKTPQKRRKKEVSFYFNL